MAKHAGQHPGDDEIGNEGINERQERAGPFHLLLALLRCLAERRLVDPAQAHVPRGAGEPGHHGGNYDGEVTDSGECHGVISLLFHPFMPPILQTIFHSSAVTGCTDRRPYFTSAMPLSFGSALIAASVTGFGSGSTAPVVTATQDSSFLAVGSG